MKTGARFHVMALAPMIGRPQSARRVRVAYHAATLSDALAWARITPPPRTAFWIQHRDEAAHWHRRAAR